MALGPSNRVRICPSKPRKVGWSRLLSNIRWNFYWWLFCNKDADAISTYAQGTVPRDPAIDGAESRAKKLLLNCC